MIFVNKNWHVDSRVGCYHFDFVNACKVEFELSEEFDVEFEGEVEQKKLLDHCDF
jgi:hypothetical protein